MDGQQRKRRLKVLPEELQADCRRIADDLRSGIEKTRDEKILTARVRICSGYYDSEHVLHRIASRLLSEGAPSPDTFLAG